MVRVVVARIMPDRAYTRIIPVSHGCTKFP